jgi:pimeloyl-ACP methyl ester carboxylesterase
MATITATLDVPGAHLYYELRGDGPLIVLAGSPMTVEIFGPLADLLATDHTVLTADPRGVGKSPVDDPDEDSTPELRADDLARLIDHVGTGPAAAVLGCSGGATSVLAFAQGHPEMAPSVIAHEPPLFTVLDDDARHKLVAASDDMINTYLRGDTLNAWREFMAIAGFPLPDEAIQAMFAERSEQEAAEDRRFFLHTMRPTTEWVPDVRALRSGNTRVQIGLGQDSAGQLCDRTSRALATALGSEPVIFPGGHTGFEDDPAAFETRLREVLA